MPHQDEKGRTSDTESKHIEGQSSSLTSTSSKVWKVKSALIEKLANKLLESKKWLQTRIDYLQCETINLDKDINAIEEAVQLMEAPGEVTTITWETKYKTLEKGALRFSPIIESMEDPDKTGWQARMREFHKTLREEKHTEQNSKQAVEDFVKGKSGEEPTLQMERFKQASQAHTIKYSQKKTALTEKLTIFSGKKELLKNELQKEIELLALKNEDIEKLLGIIDLSDLPNPLTTTKVSVYLNRKEYEARNAREQQELFNFPDTNIHLSRGPSHLDPDSHNPTQFFKKLKNQNIKHIFAIGHVHPYRAIQINGTDDPYGATCQDFTNYFIPDINGYVQLPPNFKHKISSEIIEKVGRIITYKIRIDGNAPIFVHHYPLRDGLPLNLTDEELNYVRDLQAQSLKQKILAHCYGGKGRSAQMAFILALHHKKYCGLDLIEKVKGAAVENNILAQMRYERTGNRNSKELVELDTQEDYLSSLLLAAPESVYTYTKATPDFLNAYRVIGSLLREEISKFFLTNGKSLGSKANERGEIDIDNTSENEQDHLALLDLYHTLPEKTQIHELLTVLREAQALKTVSENFKAIKINESDIWLKFSPKHIKFSKLVGLMGFVSMGLSAVLYFEAIPFVAALGSALSIMLPGFSLAAGTSIFITFLFLSTLIVAGLILLQSKRPKDHFLDRQNSSSEDQTANNTAMIAAMTADQNRRFAADQTEKVKAGVATGSYDRPFRDSYALTGSSLSGSKDKLERKEDLLRIQTNTNGWFKDTTDSHQGDRIPVNEEAKGGPAAEVTSNTADTDLPTSNEPHEEHNTLELR